MKWVWLGVGVVFLGAMVFTGVRWWRLRGVTLNTNPINTDLYPVIGGPEDLGKLLNAERLLGGNFPREAYLGEFERSHKAWKDDTLYKLSPNENYSQNPKTQPFKLVSFSKMMVEGKEWLVVGERVLNKDRSVAYLHFGYPAVPLDLPGWKMEYGRRFTKYNVYIMPPAKMTKCDFFYYREELCQKTDQSKVGSLVEEWVKTGKVPAEMETILLVGEENFY